MQNNKSENSRSAEYAQLLLRPEWHFRRQEILSRDKHVCQSCFSNGTDFDHFGRPYIIEISDTVIERKKLTSWGETVIVPEDSFKVSRNYDVKPCSLHVHHKYYIGTKLPWEYNDDALVTLCQQCHHALHAQQRIPFYKDELQIIQHYLTPCYRCEGAGHLVEFHYYKGGICFRCNGAMYDEWI